MLPSVPPSVAGSRFADNLFLVRRRIMTAKFFSALALLSMVLGLAAPAPAQDSVTGDEKIVKHDLHHRHAQAYTLTPIAHDYLAMSFPGKSFFNVVFRRYPFAVQPPVGLALTDVAFVENGAVGYLTSPKDLQNFFLTDLQPAQDEMAAVDAGLAWSRLSAALTQDGFYTFSDPQATFYPAPGPGTWGIVVGQTTVTAGGKGTIDATLYFDASRVLTDVQQTNSVRPGVRPICQATKLLDSDALVRRMAEQDILVMGKAAKGYLDEQRAKAGPELKEAIDRIWQRIQEEGW
jgi:hypothetical protein